MPYADREQQKAFDRERKRAKRAADRLDNQSGGRNIEGRTEKESYPVLPSAVPFHLTKEQQRAGLKSKQDERPWDTLSMIQAEQRIAALEEDNLLLKAQDKAHAQRIGELEGALSVIQRVASEHAPLPYTGSYLDGEPLEYNYEDRRQ